MRVSPCLDGLFLLPFSVTTENGAGGQSGCSILDKALFCIFSCIFFPNFFFLQRNYWLLERRMYGFIWFFCGGWVSFLLVLWDLFPWSSSTFHSVILILGFCSFFGLGLLFPFLYPLPRWVSGGFLPTQYEIISASNQSFSLRASPPSFLGMNWSDVIWEKRYCGVFYSLCLLVTCFWLHLFPFGFCHVRMVGILGWVWVRDLLCVALRSASNVMSLFYILNYFALLRPDS